MPQFLTSLVFRLWPFSWLSSSWRRSEDQNVLWFSIILMLYYVNAQKSIKNSIVLSSCFSPWKCYLISLGHRVIKLHFLWCFTMHLKILLGFLQYFWATISHGAHACSCHNSSNILHCWWKWCRLWGHTLFAPSNHSALLTSIDGAELQSLLLPLPTYVLDDLFLFSVSVFCVFPVALSNFMDSMNKVYVKRDMRLLTHQKNGQVESLSMKYLFKWA